MPARTTLVFAETRDDALKACDRLGLPRNRARTYGDLPTTFPGVPSTLIDAAPGRLPGELDPIVSRLERRGHRVTTLAEYEAAA